MFAEDFYCSFLFFHFFFFQSHCIGLRSFLLSQWNVVGKRLSPYLSYLHQNINKSCDSSYPSTYFGSPCLEKSAELHGKEDVVIPEKTTNQIKDCLTFQITQLKLTPMALEAPMPRKSIYQQPSIHSRLLKTEINHSFVPFWIVRHNIMTICLECWLSLLLILWGKHTHTTTHTLKILPKPSNQTADRFISEKNGK